MNAVPQASALLPFGVFAEGRRRRRVAKGWAPLAVAALDYAALAVAALASTAAGVAVWLG
jgi:hypothetical protein